MTHLIRGVVWPSRRSVCVRLLAATLACRPAPQAPPRGPGVSAAGDHHVISNVEAHDYAGSQACASCHPEISRSFTVSPMHGMTRLVESAVIHAPFAGESLHLGDDRATLETQAGGRFVRIDRPGTPPALYRVTRVLGGHHREDFVGVQVPGYSAVSRSKTGRETSWCFRSRTSSTRGGSATKATR
jgi:hypothetical protein